MSKEKVAGIVVGSVFFLIAIVLIIFVLVSGKGKDKDNNVPDETQKQEEVQNTNDENKENTENKEDVPPVEDTQNHGNKQPEKEVVEKTVSQITTISEDALTKVVEENKKFITVIANKRLLLLDENPGQSDKKMLSYCFDMYGPAPDNLLLSFYVSKSNYDSFEIGQQIEVTYSVYTNDVGTKFPVIVSIRTTDG